MRETLIFNHPMQYSPGSISRYSHRRLSIPEAGISAGLACRPWYAETDYLRKISKAIINEAVYARVLGSGIVNVD